MPSSIWEFVLQIAHENIVKDEDGAYHDNLKPEHICIKYKRVMTKIVKEAGYMPHRFWGYVLFFL